MLTKIEVVSSLSVFSSVLELPFSSDLVSESPFQIRNIEGIGPVKANINTVAFGKLDGEYFSGSSVGKRNIVLTIGFNPDWVDQSMGSLRNTIYQYFMTNHDVYIKFFNTHIPEVVIHGYVESCEPNIFSKDPEMQVSIICPQPDFVAVDRILIDGTTNLGDIEDQTEIDYIGTVPTGFNLFIHSSDAVPTYTGQFIIRNVMNIIGLTENFEFATIVDSSHSVNFSSNDGDKYINGGGSNLLPTVTVNSVWPKLRNGDNRFCVETDLAGQTWTMEYYSRFGGI